MIKLLLENIVKYMEGSSKRVRASDNESTIVIYEVKNKDDVVFTRIDIFTKKNGVNL